MKACKLIRHRSKSSLDRHTTSRRKDASLKIVSKSHITISGARNSTSKLRFRACWIYLHTFIMLFKSPLSRNIRGCFISEEDVEHFFDLHPRNVEPIFELALNRSRIHSLNIQTDGKSSKIFNTNIRITNAPINQVIFWLSRDHLGQKSHPSNWCGTHALPSQLTQN